MSNITIKQHPDIPKLFKAFPDSARASAAILRALIMDTAENTSDVHSIEETIKWGAPSYLSPIGSPIRISWSPRQPAIIGLFFICTTSLVGTFKVIYPDDFIYDKSRAILFPLNTRIHKQKTKHCIELALRYKKLRKLPLLGAKKLIY